MGYVAVYRTGEPVAYLGLETAPDEAIELCDLCNEPNGVNSMTSLIGEVWLCFKCHKVSLSD